MNFEDAMEILIQLMIENQDVLLRLKEGTPFDIIRSSKEERKKQNDKGRSQEND